MTLYIILALIIVWLLTLEIRHHSLKADSLALAQEIKAKARNLVNRAR